MYIHYKSFDVSHDLCTYKKIKRNTKYYETFAHAMKISQNRSLKTTQIQNLQTFSNTSPSSAQTRGFRVNFWTRSCFGFNRIIFRLICVTRAFVEALMCAKVEIRSTKDNRPKGEGFAHKHHHTQYVKHTHTHTHNTNYMEIIHLCWALEGFRARVAKINARAQQRKHTFDLSGSAIKLWQIF